MAAGPTAMVGRDRELVQVTRLVEAATAGIGGYWGLWALLRTAIADRGEQARDYLRAAPAGMRHTNRAALAYADAVAAGRAGRGDLASAHLAAADALLAGQPWWRRLLRLIALEAAVVDGWGDPVPALRADLAVFERDDEHQLARTARDLLRRAGEPTRRGRGSAPVPPTLRALGVTSREVDVLVLVANGLTNAEVGERLFLSPGRSRATSRGCWPKPGPLVVPACAPSPRPLSSPLTWPIYVAAPPRKPRSGNGFAQRRGLRIFSCARGRPARASSPQG